MGISHRKLYSLLLGRSATDAMPTAFLEKGEPFRERSPQRSVSTKGLGPCASQSGGPFSSKTALMLEVRRSELDHEKVAAYNSNKPILIALE